VSLIRGDAVTIPLADNTVDLIVTSPPYFALRSYTDACGTCGGREVVQNGTNGQGKSTLVGGGTRANPKPGRLEEREQENAVTADPDCPECDGSGRGHYAGQIGSEPTPAAFIDALIAVTAECVRVLKPSGSMFVNLGDKYSGVNPGSFRRDTQPLPHMGPGGGVLADTAESERAAGHEPDWGGIRTKSLMGLPWRYALRCIDDLGLILRAEIIWSKPNGLPESVQDRVRRSHEQWFHLTLEPRYYSAVDEIREASEQPWRSTGGAETGSGARAEQPDATNGMFSGDRVRIYNPLGKLPGSVWSVPTEPLRVPDHLPQHFAAFPSEWPRRIILGWSPSGICCECGQGRRPVVDIDYTTTGDLYSNDNGSAHRSADNGGKGSTTSPVGECDLRGRRPSPASRAPAPPLPPPPARLSSSIHSAERELRQRWRTRSAATASAWICRPIICGWPAGG
jgi:DNA modification methylase